MKGRIFKVFGWIISVLIIIGCIKILLDNWKWWESILACIGILIALAINEILFSKLKEEKNDKKFAEDIKKVEELILQNEYIEAKKLLEALDIKYNKKFVKRDILKLENEINYVLEKRMEIDKQLDEAEESANKNHFIECKNLLCKKVIWFEGYEVIFNEFLSEEQKARGMDLLSRCIKG